MKNIKVNKLVKKLTKSNELIVLLNQSNWIILNQSNWIILFLTINMLSGIIVPPTEHSPWFSKKLIKIKYLYGGFNGEKPINELETFRT